MLLYFKVHKFVVCTDHYLLKWIPNHPNATEKLAPWRLRLLELDFKALHRAKIINQAADSLSKLSTKNADDIPLDYGVSKMLILVKAEPDAGNERPSFTYRNEG